MDKDKLNSLLLAPDATIKEAMHRLNETAEKILFVVDGQRRLLGTVTDGDIRRGIINNSEFSDRIETVMGRNFISIPQATPAIDTAARKQMLETGVEQIPVLDDQGRITDVVVWTSILGAEGRKRKQEVRPNRIVIMAGGKGTRLDPFTRILPKPLIPIGDRAVIELIMENFHNHGFHRFVYTLNYKKEYIKAFLQENKYPYEIDWVEENTYLGTAGGLSLLRDRISDTFFVTNCDSLLVDVNFEEILKWHQEHKAAITIVGCHNEFKIPFGVLEISNGALLRIAEKPVHDVLINTGVYVMEPRVIDAIPAGSSMDMNELIDQVSKTEKITVYPISGNWLDIGQWDEYNKTMEHLKTKGEHD